MCTTTTVDEHRTDSSAQNTMESAANLRATLKDLDAQKAGIETEVSQITERLNAPGQPGVTGSLLDKEGFPRADIDVHAVRRDRHRLACLTNDHKALTERLAQLLAALHHAQARERAATSTHDGVANPNGDTGAAPSSSSAQAVGGPSGEAGEASGPAAAAGPGVASGLGAGPSAAAATVGGGGSAAGAGDTAAAGSGPGGSAAACVAAPRPFALIDEVSEGSPAATAGLQVGDLLCRFGDVALEPQAASSGPGGEGPEADSGALLRRVAGVLQGSEGRAVGALVLRHGLPVQLQLVPGAWSGRGLLGCHLRPL